VPNTETLREIVVALAGNPNAGKTTVFNALTGARAHVGNYPGVTVERGEAAFEHDGIRMRVVDLPGSYSLNAMSDDERVARDFILREKPGVVVGVVDGSNLERNLYLFVQLMELRVPLVLAFNKTDIARRRGLLPDLDRLSTLLGVPIVPMVACADKGVMELKNAVTAAANRPPRPSDVRYGEDIERELDALTSPATPVQLPGIQVPPRWIALKLIENDEAIRSLAAAAAGGAKVLAAADAARARLRRHTGQEPELAVADRRYGFISGACQECMPGTAETRHLASDRVDDILTSDAVGLPIFFVVMYLLFKLTFSFAEPAAELIGSAFDTLSAAVAGTPALPAWLRSLLAEGVLSGVGGVLRFAPNMALLFFFIAFLEETGYMARGAFLMDRFMHRIGLHGRSFVPMVIGFGCTVPAVMATRSLRNRTTRMTTIMVLPLISCGARFPIYSLLIAALFPAGARAAILMTLYLIGIALAAAASLVLRKTVFAGDTEPFVMELPPYRAPPLRALFSHTLERLKLFARKAATVILGASVILWGLTTFPRPAPPRVEGLSPAEARRVAVEGSAAATIGRWMAPAMRHIGFDWQASTALVGAFAAKEIFVAQLGIINAVDTGEESLAMKLRSRYTPLQGFCMMIFSLISLPCVATFAVTRTETGTWRWAIAQAVGLTLLAYAVTFVVYQTGLFLGFGAGGRPFAA